MTNWLLLNNKHPTKQQASLMLCLLFSTFIFSQNLIPNPSFENKLSCPPNGEAYYATGWFQPCIINGNVYNSNSSDLFDTCAIGGGNCPNSVWGFQYAKTGGSYAGIAIEINNGTIREYLEIKLLDTLSINQVYCLSVFVNLAEKSKHYIANFEVVFTQDTLHSPNYNFINIPTKTQLSTNFIGDTVNWVKIQNNFKADSAYQFITIGNFSSPAQTPFLTNNTGVLPSAYYYFDDFSLVKIDTTDIHAGADTSICIGTSITLGQDTTTDAIYHWQPAAGLNDTNAMHPIANPTVTTTYILKKTICKLTLTDTITVTVGCIGMEEMLQRKDANVYPNPFNNALSFSLKKSDDYMVKLYDITGKLITEHFFSGKEFELATTELNNGLYYYAVQNSRGEKVRGKVIKQ